MKIIKKLVLILLAFLILMNPLQQLRVLLKTLVINIGFSAIRHHPVVQPY